MTSDKDPTKDDTVKVLTENISHLTEEIAYLKGEDIALIKRLIQLHIMISRQKREDAKIAAILKEDLLEDDDDEDLLTPTDQEPTFYKYQEPSVDDVEREAQTMTSTLVNIITKSGPHPVTNRKQAKQTAL